MTPDDPNAAAPAAVPPAGPAAAVLPAAMPVDPRSLAALRERHGPRYRWWVLLAVMLGTMASVMSSTIVNVALPEMSRVFALGQERAQWLAAGFMAAMTVSMLTTPWWLERYGYRLTCLGAVGLLMAGGIGGGLAGSYELVLAMRVAEGLAAGVLQPVPAIIIMNAFEPSERGRAMGLFGMGVVLAPALGPSIGGVLVEAYGWRSIFFVVVPLCLAALALSLRFLPHGAPGGRPVGGAGGVRLDLPGLAWVTLAILALLNGMVHLHDAAAAPAWGLLAVAAAAFAAFVRRQRRAERPLLAPALFGHAQFTAGGAVAFIYGAALFGSTYLVPVFMQVALGLPPSQAGAVLLPAGLLLALTMVLVGPASGRWSAHLPVSGGLALLAASFALMLGVGPGTSLVLITAWAAVGRVGLGFVLPSLNLGALRPLPAALVSQGSSAVNFLRQLGGAVGVGLTGVFLQWRLHAHGAGPGVAGSDPSHAGRLAAFHETFLLLAVLTALAIAAAWRMRDAPPAPAAAAP